MLVGSTVFDSNLIALSVLKPCLREAMYSWCSGLINRKATRLLMAGFVNIASPARFRGAFSDAAPRNVKNERARLVMKGVGCRDLRVR